MSIPLFVSERSKREITTRPLSVGCLVFERMDQIDFTGPFEVLCTETIEEDAREAVRVALLRPRRPYGDVHTLGKRIHPVVTSPRRLSE